MVSKIGQNREEVDMPTVNQNRSGHEPRTGTAADLRPAADPHQLLDEAAAHGAAFVAWWETTSADPLALDVVLAELRRLAAAYLASTPGPVVRELCWLRDHLLDLLRRPQQPGLARDLQLAAGYTCSLLAWASGDLGHLGAAATQAAVAAFFANASGASELNAWVWAVRSKTSFWRGDLTTAARQAAAGLAQAPASEVRVLLAAQLADACATQGAAEAARGALTQIAAAREAVAAADTIGGLLSCPPTRQANYESGVHQRLGANDRAVSAGESALALASRQPIRSYATEAQIRLNLVDVFLDLGDVEAADDAIRPVLRLSPERRLHTLTRRVHQVGQRLTASPLVTATGAVDLRERCLHFGIGSTATA
jgi:tetratricopeptide (TPR) repeat protein